jgi:hypothetical protein
VQRELAVASVDDLLWEARHFLYSLQSNDFSANGNDPLTSCLSPKVHSETSPFPDPCPAWNNWSDLNLVRKRLPGARVSPEPKAITRVLEVMVLGCSGFQATLGVSKGVQFLRASLSLEGRRFRESRCQTRKSGCARHRPLKQISFLQPSEDGLQLVNAWAAQSFNFKR